MSGAASPPAAEAAPLVAFLTSDLSGGGVQRMISILARAFVERGCRVDVVAGIAEGELAQHLAPGVRVVPLRRGTWLEARLAALRADPGGAVHLLKPILTPRRGSPTVDYLPGLVEYLQAERPASLFAATPFLNVEAILARRLAGVATRVVVSERTHFSTGKPRKEWQRRTMRAAMQRCYLQADAVTAVSQGVADDLAATIDIPRDSIDVLYNPTLTPDFEARAAEPVDHPWFAPGQPPVVVAVGRVSYQKDFPTLVRAFARVRRNRPARLAIVGRYNSEDKLMGLAQELGVREDVALLGFRANPLPYTRAASVFALSSLFEGFPNVLLEALGCGTPVVSTDCPAGPHEMLDGGRYGALVPVGDDAALARAIEETLDHPPDREALRARARRYGYASAVARYLEVILGEARPCAA